MAMSLPIRIEMTITEILRLLQFGDSVLPVGAFSFSNGLETAVQLGLVKDKETLKEFTQTALQQAANVDGVALLVTHRAAGEQNLDEVLRIDRALLARKVNEESATMAVRMGRKLGELGQRVLGSQTLNQWLEHIKKGKTPGTYAVGQGILFAELGLPEKEAFAVHQYGVASTILGASMRLMRVDHLDTQELLYQVNAEAEEEYLRVSILTLEEMASHTPALDIFAGIHVKSHVRLFMN